MAEEVEHQVYRRQLGMDIGSFADMIDQIIPTIRNPILLALQYPGIGNPYAAGTNLRLQTSGRTLQYREIRFSDNSHLVGYSPEEIRDKTPVVIGLVLAGGIIPYLRKVQEDAGIGGESVYFAYRLPHPGGVKTLEEIEKELGV